ncbi:hypothetical protein [uncultured Deinococcus sp.]|uniref:hypothetical protein n=1 Tax=uncultured Deinococcus sp. TaxID=158789 RepID=UPI0025DC7858|nr:hypothetical protein [uncultured Deinococcus sp.]
MLYALGHPVRRWIVEHAVKKGRVSTREVFLEWPVLRRHWDMSEIFRSLADKGVLKRVGYAGRSHYYGPGPQLIQELRELHTLTGDLLAALEVPRETHD